MTTLIPPTTDYSDLDKSALDSRIRQLTESAFPTWTDAARANFGNLINEWIGFNGDVLNYYQGRNFRECFFAWLTQRKNALAKARAYGYTPSGLVAAQYTETFSIPVAVAGNVTIAAGTIVKTMSATTPISFQLLADAIIVAGLTSITGVVENSEYATDNLTSDGTPNQIFDLGTVGFIDDSLTLIFGGETYTEVENFFSSTASDAHYTLWVDQNDRARVTLGNGVNGKIPVKSTTGTGVYKVGGGSAGNVEAGMITKILGSFTDSFGTAVVVSCTNAATATTQGSDRETVTSIKARAPAMLRSPINSIGDDDFETHSLLLPCVARALPMGYDDDSGIDVGMVYIYIVPTDDCYPVSQTLLDSVKTICTVTYPNSTGEVVLPISAPRLVINVHAKIYARVGVSIVTAAANVRAALTVYFDLYTTDDDTGDEIDNPNIDFGYRMVDADGVPLGLIALSDVYNIVRDSSGVLKIGTADADFTLNGSHADLAIDDNEFPQLGTVELIDGSTGLSV